MGLFAAFVFLLFVAQDSLTIKVEVQEGTDSVVLPCQYSQPLEEIFTVKWSRHDLNPNIVHQRREGDDVQSQNQLFSGRTSMRSDALDSGNFSLTLRKPQLSDIGNYICSITDDEDEATLSDVQLHVIASRESFMVKVEVQEGTESVVLPCQYNQVLEEIVTVKWSRRDLNPSIVHQRREGDDLQSQNQLFSGRTSMRSDTLDSGNFSLTLRNFQLSDVGNYICSMIDEEEEKTLSEVELQLKVSQDSLTKKVEVQWVQSVVLPCQYSQPLEEMVTVKWRRLDLNPDTVHQRREGDDLESQNELFKGRTLMRADAFDSGDFSLTLSELQLSDSGSYTCSMIDDEEKETTLSEVHLLVKEIPTWAIVLPVLLGLLILIISCGLLFHFRDKFESARARIILGVLIVLVVLAVSGGLLYHFQYKFKSEMPSWAIFVVFLLFFLTIDVGLIHHFQKKIKESSTWSRMWWILLALLCLLGPVAIIGIFYLFGEIMFPWIGVMLVLYVFFESGNILFHFPCVMSGRCCKLLVVMILSVIIFLGVLFPFILELSTWARILLVLFVLLLLSIDVGLLFHYFQQHFMSVNTRSVRIIYLHHGFSTAS